MDKKKIIKYAGAALLSLAVCAGAGINVYDAQVDHTNEVCLITQIFNDYSHQFNEMQKEWKAKGFDNVSVRYGIATNQTTTIYQTKPYSASYSNTEMYSAPDGFTLAYNENGEVVGEKKITSVENLGIGFTSYFDDGNKEVLLVQNNYGEKCYDHYYPNDDLKKDKDIFIYSPVIEKPIAQVVGKNVDESINDYILDIINSVDCTYFYEKYMEENNSKSFFTPEKSIKFMIELLGLPDDGQYVYLYNSDNTIDLYYKVYDKNIDCYILFNNYAIVNHYLILNHEQSLSLSK